VNASEHCTSACRARQQLQSHVHAAQDACRRAAAIAAMVAPAVPWQPSDAAGKDTTAASPATEEWQHPDEAAADQGVMHEDEVVAAAAAVVAHVDTFNTAGEEFS
jgi:hypothetical protein